MPRRPWLLDAYVVRLGMATKELVDEGRGKFHEWIARRILSYIEIRRPAETTTSLSPEQIRRNPRLLGDLLNLSSEDDERVVTIMDCSLNHYEELGENILFSVALCAANFAKTPNHVCVVMLPQFPHNYHSFFWDPLNDLNVSGGTVMVFNNEGKVRVAGHPRVQNERIWQSYEKKQQELIGTRQTEFRDKIIRRMGHFKITDEYCSRYFFDGERTERELPYLLVDQIAKLVPRALMARTELIVPDRVDLWMGDATTLACGMLNISQTRWPAGDDDPIPSPNKHARYLVVMDFVNTASAYARIVKDARDAGFNLHNFAVSVLAARDLVTDDDLPQLYAIERVSVDRVTQRTCIQCELGLPFTGKHREEMLGLRSFDAWDMLSHVPWPEEAYGPPEHRRQKVHPNFVKLFDEFGDYIAYKLEMVLRNLVQGSPVAVACPAEPGIQAVVKRMQPWADDRIVAVRIPREVLENSRRLSGAEIRDSGGGQEWARQLKHLAERNADVVLLDEINGSNRTARQMIKVLASFNLTIRAYAPIFNFVPNESLDGIRVVALYDVPSPRREDS